MIATIFDTETTGLTFPRVVPLERQPSIIEFYAAVVDLKTTQILSEFQTLIKPPKPLTDSPASGSKRTISQITGITNGILKDAPSFDDIHKKLLDLIQRSAVMIAHNAPFDKEMCDIEFERLGIVPSWPRIICTIEATMQLKGHRLTLQNLHKELFDGAKFTGAHRAKSDVQALIKCSCELYKRGMI